MYSAPRLGIHILWLLDLLRASMYIFVAALRVLKENGTAGPLPLANETETLATWHLKHLLRPCTSRSIPLN
jgi:hypothetical protein